MTDMHHSDEFDIELVCDFRLLSQEMLRAMIPKKWLKEAKAVSVDQTAFPTFFKCRDFRRQADVEQEVQRAIEETGMIPDDLQLGPDGKLIRCDDLDARAGRRSASAATGHKATGFLGYFVTFAVLTRLASSDGDSEEGQGQGCGALLHRRAVGRSGQLSPRNRCQKGCRRRPCDSTRSRRSPHRHGNLPTRGGFRPTHARAGAGCHQGLEVQRGADEGDRGRHRQTSPTPAHRGRDVLPDVAAQEVQAGSSEPHQRATSRLV